MDENAEPRDADMSTWLLFWVQLLVLAAIAGFGLAFAAAGREPGDYEVGLGLAIASIVLVFLLLKLAFDGNRRGRGEFFFVHDSTGLFVVIPIFAALGVAGIFLAAAWKSGSLYVTGLALFAVSALMILLNIKNVFDRSDSGRR